MDRRGLAPLDWRILERIPDDYDKLLDYSPVVDQNAPAPAPTPPPMSAPMPPVSAPMPPPLRPQAPVPAPTPPVSVPMPPPLRPQAPVPAPTPPPVRPQAPMPPPVRPQAPVPVPTPPPVRPQAPVPMPVPAPMPMPPPMPGRDPIADLQTSMPGYGVQVGFRGEADSLVTVMGQFTGHVPHVEQQVLPFYDCEMENGVVEFVRLLSDAQRVTDLAVAQSGEASETSRTLPWQERKEKLDEAAHRRAPESGAANIKDRRPELTASLCELFAVRDYEGDVSCRLLENRSSQFPKFMGVDLTGQEVKAVVDSLKADNDGREGSSKGNVCTSAQKRLFQRLQEDLKSIKSSTKGEFELSMEDWAGAARNDDNNFSLDYEARSQFVASISGEIDSVRSDKEIQVSVNVTSDYEPKLPRNPLVNRRAKDDTSMLKVRAVILPRFVLPVSDVPLEQNPLMGDHSQVAAENDHSPKCAPYASVNRDRCSGYPTMSTYSRIVKESVPVNSAGASKLKQLCETLRQENGKRHVELLNVESVILRPTPRLQIGDLGVDRDFTDTGVFMQRYGITLPV